MKHATSKNKFFDNVIQALEHNFSGDNHAQFEKVQCVVIGSPGFVKDNFYTYLKDVSEKKGNNFLKEVLGKLVLSHCSSGFKHSLKEILNNSEVTRRIENMSCSQENKILNRFFELLAKTEEKITYGPKSVTIALREMAVETLLISDKLFRAKNVEQRKFYVEMHENALRDGL